MTDAKQDKRQAHGSGLTSTEPASPIAAGITPVLKAGVVLMVFSRDSVDSAPLAPGQSLVVGRGQTADLRIPEPKLSRDHARFTLGENGVVVEDLGSANGTWQGDTRIERVTIGLGSEVMLSIVTVRVFGIGMAPDPTFVGEATFRKRLEEELERTQVSRRPFALLAVRAADAEVTPNGVWALNLKTPLRSIDHVSLYAPTIALILLRERDLAEARQVANGIVAGAPASSGPRLVGGAVYPGAASSVDKLIEVARQNLMRARPGEPALETPARGQPCEEEAPIFGAKMQEALRIIRRAAPARAPVLLLGETGTGKEVLAQHLVESGPRSKRPFIAINCGAAQTSLIASELFGHEKGAFTGADKQRMGAFREADGGTLLLDEVGELPLEAQKALLRVLQERRVTPVGSTDALKVDVRIVAATRRNINDMLAEGSFREDLYHRLNTVEVHIPALRERKDEIQPLADRFLRMANSENNGRVKGFSAEAKALLHAYRWPGNIRELKNVIDWAVMMAEGELIQREDLPPRVRNALPEPDEGPASGLSDNLRQTAKQQIEEALRETNGNKTQAAARLKIPRRTLVDQIKKLNIESPKKPRKK